jgi:cytochrome c-type biogenesis protein CcmF
VTAGNAIGLAQDFQAFRGGFVAVIEDEAVGVAIVAAVLAEILEGRVSLMGGLGLFAAFWVFASVATDLWERVRPAGGVRSSLLHRWRQIPRAVHGMMLAVACGAVLLGTLYPLFLDALNLGKISVGPPYFDTVFGLLMAPLLLVMGIGPLARWKTDEPGPLLKRLGFAFFAAGAAAFATGALAGKVTMVATGGLWLTYWIVASLLVDLKSRLLPAGGSAGQIVDRARKLPRAMWGMFIAHFGIAAFSFGVAMVRTYDVERDVKMGPGSTVEVNGYVFKMEGVRDVQGANYVAARATITVEKGGQLLTTLYPEKRIYRVQQNPMTESAVDTDSVRDLYVSMGEQLPGGDWVVRVQVKPFIAWIWKGCLIMMLGGIIAATDRRYRVKAPATETSGALAEGAR